MEMLTIRYSHGRILMEDQKAKEKGNTIYGANEKSNERWNHG